MKQSKFTTVLPIDDESTEYVIHNTLTNALATLTHEKYELYKKILDDKDYEVPEDLLRQFKSGGFVVDDNMDEMVNYEFYHLSDRFNSSALILTIAPSLECQFGCPYCYEAGVNNNARMSESTQNAIINFIRRKNPRELIIHWYGGEPLLQMDIIENMTKRIQLYCEENATHYDAEIITNGYLMDEAMLNRMLHCRIAKAQITIDGAKEIHDSRRYLIGGGPTYETIMSNLENAAGRIKINLRVNVDKTNEKQIDELGAELANKNILDNVHAYLGHVTSTDEYEGDFCISRQRYSELEDEWYEKLSQYSKAKKYTKLYHYPTQTMCRCIAETGTGYVIDHNGQLYKCWNHIGREEHAVGSVLSENIKTCPNQLKYTMSQDIYNRACENCKMLPYCGGGCLDEYLRFGKQRCHPRKFNYEGYLIELAKEIVNNKVK